MANPLTAYFHLADLYVAYRKAKVDMYYERDHCVALEFAAYEQDLDVNLRSLHQELTKDEVDWFKRPAFVGTYSYVPKTLNAGAVNEQFIESSNDFGLKENSEKPKAIFRMIGVHPVNFHIVSALWIYKVGHLFDALLGKAAYGSRLKSLTQSHDLAIGSFHPYTFGFKQWRERGIDAMKAALKGGQHVIAITADLRRFYHEVSPAFLLHPDFLERHKGKLELSEEQKAFTTLLIESIRTWAEITPEHKEHPGRGIPIGLTASRVIANVLLEKFDAFIEGKLAPLYYGRYVDDVFLVLGNWPAPKSPEEVWSALIAQSEGLLSKGIDNSNGHDEVAYWIHQSFSEDSLLRFAGEKQKIFSLTGKKGVTLLDSIISTITERSSDWRLLPDLAEDETALISDVIAASKDVSDEADNLRKSDGISVKRLAFAIRLRNFEAVEKHLRPNAWKRHRDIFFQLALDHIVTAPGFFSFAPYLPRLVGLSVACNDWNHAIALIEKLNTALKELDERAECDFAEISLYRGHLFKCCYEAATKAYVHTLDAESGMQKLVHKIKKALEVADGYFIFGPGDIWYLDLMYGSANALVHYSRILFSSDLARTPWREVYLDSLFNTSRSYFSVGIRIGIEEVVEDGDPPPSIQARFLFDELTDFFEFISGTKASALPEGLVFSTRPFSLAELTQLDPSCLEDSDKLVRRMKALRGYSLSGPPEAPNKLPYINGDVLHVHVDRKRSAPTVALPCFETKNDSWIACVADYEDPDTTRYFRLNNLVNQVLKGHIKADYLVLPECSLPRAWFDWLANKLAQSGVSLIAGLEYAHWKDDRGKRYVSNEVRASLITSFGDRTEHIVLVQEKSAPAINEGRQLFDIAGLTMKSRKEPRKLVVNHGEFFFGVLICSELTNIMFRAQWRGRIDPLFVPEWNSDLDSFSPIVEASALDIHCYVVQVNNRLFGDCRIRAPFRTPHQRDVARIRGGKTDYHLVAQLDVNALRAFQSNFRSPDGGQFKPVPDGYRHDSLRRLLPRQ